MEKKKNTTVYGDILNDIKELKELVLKMYTVAAFYGDDESAQKGYEDADDFNKKVSELEKRFLEKASFIGNQISYGDFDDIITEKGRLRKEILEYLDKDDKEKNATRERYIRKIEEIGETVEKKSTEESWDDLREIVEEWRREFKDNSRFEVLEHEINKSISKTSLMILESQAQSGEKVDLNPVDEVCSRDALVNTIKEKLVQKGKDAYEIEKKREYFEIAQNLTEKRLSDPKLWELLVEKESVKVKVEEKKTTAKQKNISKPGSTGLLERFKGKTIYTFGDIDPDTGEWINVEEVHARYPQILSKKQADRLLKIEINGVKSVKFRDFNKSCPGIYLSTQPYTPKYEHLQEVVLGDDVKVIEEDTFSYHKSLKSVKFGKGLEYIPQGAFKGCGLTKIEIPGNIKAIGDSAFENCEKLTDVILEEGVEEIGRECFAGCISLNSISPMKNATLDSDSLRIFSRTNNVKIGEGNHEIIYTFGDIDPNTKEWSNLTKMFLYGRYLYNVSSDIADRVLRVEVNCKGKISSGVFSKKDSALLRIFKKTDLNSFPVFENLQEVVIGDGVNKILDLTFTWNKSLKKVILKKTEGVQYVGEKAFCGNYPDTKIVTPDGVEIELRDYLDCFQNGKLNPEKLKSLISNNKKNVQSIEESEESQNVDKNSATHSVFSKKLIDGIASEKEVAMEDENSDEVIAEIEGKSKEEQENHNPNLE